MEANYLGTVYATRAALPYMKKSNHGRIVFISSQAGQLGLYGYSSYSGSKFALRGFAEALQMEVFGFIYIARFEVEYCFYCALSLFEVNLICLKE